MKRVKNFNRLFVIILIFLLGTFNSPFKVQAEENGLIYDSLSIFVMPQYTTPEDWDIDKPAVFISLYGSLVNESDTPYSGEIRIPTFSSELSMHFSLAGRFDDQGTVEVVEATVDEKTDEIVWELDHEVEPSELYNFVVEYYFAFDYDDTDYEFTFPYQIERNAKIMDMLFFEPYNAEDFAVEGDIGEGEETNSFGITAHKFDLGEVEAKTQFDIAVSYKKDDTVTTLEAIETLIEQADELADLTNDPAAQETSSASPSSVDVELMITSSIGVIVVLLLAFFIFQNYRKNRKKDHVA